MKWVTVKKAAELSGYSEKAIDRKREDGIWLEGVIWRKAPDGRIMISPDAIDAWVEGRPQHQPHKWASALLPVDPKNEPSGGFSGITSKKKAP